MRNRIQAISSQFVGAGILAVITFASVGLSTLVAQTSADSTHAAHVASGAMPPESSKGDPALSQQIAQLQAKVAQLESTLYQNIPLTASSPSGPGMPGMPGGAAPAMTVGMDDMKGGGGVSSASSGASPAPVMPSMSGPATPQSGMMGMMSQMMGMMEKMMSMPGSGTPMQNGGMEMDKMKMGSGALPPPATAGMSGGMVADQMKLAGMMGMGPMSNTASGTPQSALPGYPGSSHLYHIGATDFFLDHPQHIALTTEQQSALNKAKEQATLVNSSADRAVEQAEQELWTLTAADQPDATVIQAKIAAIGKLTGDKRFAFIRAVGDASKILTDEQRKSLTGFSAPAPANSMTAPITTMPASGMSHM